MTINIKEITTSHGHQRYMVDLRPGHNGGRKYFRTEAEAHAAVSQRQSDARRYGEMFARLTELERMELGVAHERAKCSGFRVCDAVEHYRVWTSTMAAVPPVGLGEAVDKCLADKRAMGLRPRSLSALGSTLNRFRKLGETLPLGDMERSHVKGWLIRGTSPDGNPWSTRTRNGYLTDLNTFFNWATDEKHLDKNPIGGMKRFRPSKSEEEAAESKRKILFNSEVAATLRHTAKADPDIMAHVALSWFAGLRPERECAGMRWEDILMDEKLVYVRRSIAKTRQDRYIPMVPALFEWLQWCRDKGAPLPAPRFAERWEQVRKDCGLWKHNWPSDGTRHTFASNHLAVYGEAPTIDALGHGSYDMLFKHYRVLVKKANAEEFFGLTPSVLPC
tara:strand:- start:1765 stop:2934 length:1170 start_codon:yes stop_codon:yes gene_type:complete